MSAALIMSVERLLIALKDHDLSPQAYYAYYNIVQILIEMRTKEIQSALEDVEFQIFLSNLGVVK